MPITLADAAIFLFANRQQLDKDLSDTERDTRSWAGRVGSSVANIAGTAVMGAATAAAGAIVGIGVAAFNVANEVDQATDMLRTQLGLTTDEAAAYAETLKTVYADNFGESIADVGEALAVVRQGLHGAAQASQTDLGNMTEYALGLRDAFDIDINESIRVANQIITQFGTTGDQAFALITTGMQNGLNSTDDFIDTLNEYSADFADLGFTADQVLNLLNSGLEGGIYNTDKIGDALREFKINLSDVGRMDTIRGMNADIDATIDAFNQGRITGVDAFNQIQVALRGIEDPMRRQEIGVAFMGSMWEDLGAEAMLALDTMSGGITVQGDALDSLNAQYDNFGSLFEGIKRQALIALEPLGAKLLEIANQALPYLSQAFDWLAQAIPPVIDFIVNGLGNAFSQMLTFFAPIIEAIQLFAGQFQFAMDNGAGALEAIGFAISSVLGEQAGGIFRGLGDAAGGVVGFFTESLVPAFQNVAGWIGEQIPVVLEFLSSVWANVLQPAIAGVWAFIQDSLIPAFQSVAAWVGEQIPRVIQFLSDAWTNVLSPAINAIWSFIRDNLIPIFQRVVEWVGTAIPNVIQFLTNAWNNILAPALNVIWSFIQDNLIPIFQQVFEWLGQIIPPIITALSNLWTNLLQPAIELVWTVLSEHIIPVLTEVARIISEVVGVAFNVIAGIINNVVMPVFNSIWNFIQNNVIPVFNFLATLITDVVGGAFNAVSGIIEGVIGGIGSAIQGIGDFINSVLSFDLGAALGDLVPEFLRPGSPTPFEIGLRGATGALKDMKAVAAMDIGGSLSAAGITGGTTNNSGATNNISIGNISIGSARTQEEANAAADMFTSALARKGYTVTA